MNSGFTVESIRAYEYMDGLLTLKWLAWRSTKAEAAVQCSAVSTAKVRGVSDKQ